MWVLLFIVVHHFDWVICISQILFMSQHDNEEQIMGHNFSGSHGFNKHRMQAAQLGLAPISFNLSSKGWKMCAIVAWGLDRNYPALSCICQHSSGTNSEDDKSVIVVQSPITWCSAQHGCISEITGVHIHIWCTDFTWYAKSLSYSIPLAFLAFVFRFLFWTRGLWLTET